MTIDSEAGALAAPSAGDHGHHRQAAAIDAGAHSHGAHDHGAHGPAAHDHERDDERVSAGGFSPFLASAFDRLAIAVVLTGLVWIGVMWALA